MAMEGSATIEEAHVVNGEDSMHVRMIQQTPSHTSTFMAINNHKTLNS
jgi:hypothetical protein